jgi:hypothetical protein
MQIARRSIVTSNYTSLKTSSVRKRMLTETFSNRLRETVKRARLCLINASKSWTKTTVKEDAISSEMSRISGRISCEKLGSPEDYKLVDNKSFSLSAYLRPLCWARRLFESAPRLTWEKARKDGKTCLNTVILGTKRHIDASRSCSLLNEPVIPYMSYARRH